MISKEMKDKIYNFYRIGYCEAVAEVLHGKDITEATQEEAEKIIDLLCNLLQSSDFSDSNFQEFILDKLIEDNKKEKEVYSLL